MKSIYILRALTDIVIGVFSILLLPLFACCQTNRKMDRTWAIYKADANSSNYSPLDQINVSNVSQLQPAWTFTIKDMPELGRPSQCNPIIVDGVMYATAASQWAYAINAETGKQIWSFDPLNGAKGGEVNRGLTYWENGKDKRILMSAKEV